MQVVRRLILVVFLGSFILQCNAQKEEINKEYIVEGFKSENDSNSYLTLETFHFEKPRDVLPVSFVVNDIIVNNDVVEKKLLPFTQVSSR